MAKQPKRLSIGDKFNHMEVVKELIIKGKDWRSNKIRYIFRCDCGNEKELEGYKVVKGYRKSCGCKKYRYENVSVVLSKPKKYTDMNLKEFRKEYMTWIRMNRRCSNPDSDDYSNYGERGIKVCKQWRNDFKQFLKDMGKRPGKGYSIGRKDNDGDYTPDNCRWETIKQQNSNKGDTRFLEIEGMVKTVAQWARIAEISENTIRGRLRRKWSNYDAVYGPKKQIMHKVGNRWRKRSQ